MLCASCGNEVPARPTCLRCGVPLFGEAVLPPSALGPVRVPLTAGQKARLLARFLPLLTFSLMTAGYLALAAGEVVPPPKPLLWLVIAAAVLATGYDALLALRDLGSGVALTQEDLLERSYRSRRPQGQNRCFGDFGRLGTLRLPPAVLIRNPPGQRYRVIFSPASRIVWALEPPEERIRP